MRAVGIFGLWLGLSLGLGSCGKCGGGTDATTADAGDPNNSAPAKPDPEALRQAKLDAEFPLHGLVTGLQLKIRKDPEPSATTIGWLRVGSRVRLAKNPKKTKTCASGWHRIAPRGWACAGEGIEVGEMAPESALALTPPARAAGLPYRYYFVKEAKVPEYHRLPSRNEQRAARDFLARYFELKEKQERRAQRFYQGEIEREMKRPAVIRRFLDRGFFVAGAGFEERSSRKFVRTVRGRYIKLAQLEERTGTDFEGVELGPEQGLPVAWASRKAQPFGITVRDDGTLRMTPDPQAEAYKRHQVVPWAGYERIGSQILHKLPNGLYLKYWFLAVAEKIDPPKGVGNDEPWVHINLKHQTLVLYQGDAPIYATLVSSGLPDHETPVGLFEIRVKQVADTMSDIGPDVGKDDRYSIEDVPWTQYFDGSIAMHGAFWHERFGLQRSHGCVNLAPRDARRVFEHTLPQVSDGWHGATTEKSGLPASKVWITEK